MYSDGDGDTGANIEFSSRFVSDFSSYQIKTNLFASYNYV